ncbi:hypothetical protein KKP04_01145 [Rhodomicrobium sp. Az07]|uniref:hypothetical protein n=1 Tax=Rhodomicrobium sp. Az07 TaxID=2839034 RepID=UPI001BE9A523|nr:hypothetical protein [Rhodomicrobium sp. Az07]MBT3069476.1 hypothetical protein [Rhodomicrobium sp. Az07]
MKIVLVGSVDPWTRSVATVHRYVALGPTLGHDVALYGHPNPELPDLKTTLDTDDADLVVFLVQVPRDIPDMPGLARMMDRIPREKRVVLDLWGRFNETIRIDHDFNHLEKFDGHPSWEWIEAISALGGVVLQPTLKPRRPDVGSFLFHGFDRNAVARPCESAEEAAARWKSADRAARPYGAVYVGSNWQRWSQVRPFLEHYRAVADKVGQICLAGWDWTERPGWAVELGLLGVDTDPDLLADLRVEVRMGIRFDRVVPLLAQGRFAPVFHRPLFSELGLVTNRTFETFLADTVPVLMLPKAFVEEIFGAAALKLVPKEGVARHLEELLDDPVATWDAVLKTRQHLARHHSFERRFAELEALTAAPEALKAAS